ncbi:MAG: hypothetical protein Tsb0020_39550 [Haliangiales bacterium]
MVEDNEKVEGPGSPEPVKTNGTSRPDSDSGPEHRVPPGPDPAEPDVRFGDLPKGVRQRLEAVIPEMVKRTFATGMGALFTTEEGIRRVAKEVSLPKEMAGYLANTAGDAKDEILRIIAREVRVFLESVNLSEEIAKMLTTLSFEVKTEIRFIPNEEKYGSVRPDVKARVGIKKNEERPRRRRRRRRFRDDDSDRADNDSPTSSDDDNDE